MTKPPYQTVRGLLTFNQLCLATSRLELMRQAERHLIGIRLGVLSSVKLGLQVAGRRIKAGALAERIHIADVGTVVLQLEIAVVNVFSFTVESTDLERAAESRNVHTGRDAVALGLANLAEVFSNTKPFFVGWISSKY